MPALYSMKWPINFLTGWGLPNSLQPTHLIIGEALIKATSEKVFTFNENNWRTAEVPESLFGLLNLSFTNHTMLQIF